MKTIRQTIIDNLLNKHKGEILVQKEYDGEGNYVEVKSEEIQVKCKYFGNTVYIWIGRKGKLVWSVKNLRSHAEHIIGNFSVELKQDS